MLTFAGAFHRRERPAGCTPSRSSINAAMCGIASCGVDTASRHQRPAAESDMHGRETLTPITGRHWHGAHRRGASSHRAGWLAGFRSRRCVLSRRSLARIGATLCYFSSNSRRHSNHRNDRAGAWCPASRRASAQIVEFLDCPPRRADYGTPRLPRGAARRGRLVACCRACSADGWWRLAGRLGVTWRTTGPASPSCKTTMGAARHPSSRASIQIITAIITALSGVVSQSSSIVTSSARTPPAFKRCWPARGR